MFEPSSLDKKIHNLLNSWWDHLLCFRCCFMWTCGLPLSRCYLILPVRLSSSVLSQTMIGLSSGCLSFLLHRAHLPQLQMLLKSFSAFVGSGDFLIFPEERRKKITLRKRWMSSNKLWRIYGDFLHIKCFTSTNKASLLTSLCYKWRWGNIQSRMYATRGCRLPSRSQTKPHYHKKLILSSVRFLCFVLISLLLSAHWCAAFVWCYWGRPPIKQWIGILKFECYFAEGLSSSGALWA